VFATLAVGTVAALAVAGTVTAGGRGRTVAGTGLLRTAAHLSNGSGQSRAALLIVGTSEASAAARKPGRSLVYFSGTDVNTRWSTGVPYAQAKQNGWLLRSASGKLLVNRSHPDNYVGAVGNPAYQRAWIRNVSRFLKAHGDDGILIDDVLADLVPLAGSEAAAYPTQQAWAAAQLSFIRAVGTALRARGYYVLASAAGYVPGDPGDNTGATTVSWWRKLNPYVSGLMNEYYGEIPDGSSRLRSEGEAWSQSWGGWQRLIRVAQARGRDFVGLTYGRPGDTRTMTYGKASFLLDWDGRGGAFVYQPTDNGDAWNNAWTQDLGRPVGRKHAVGAGWMRRYRHGVVLLNPSAAAGQRFALRRRYVAAGGHVVRTATLPPTTGLILRAAKR
jgi:putative glycosyl hydrolase-like family 15 (GHL15) protein